MTTVNLCAPLLGASLALCSTLGFAADPPMVPKQLPPETKASDPIIGLSFYSQYASEYNFRGVSQSNRKGSYQTFFETQLFNNLVYAGFYTWQVRLPTRPDFEFDLVAGIRPTFNKLSLDLGVAYYYYPNEQRLTNPVDGGFLTTANSDFIEYAAKALYQLTPELTLGANAFHAPNFFGQHAVATYVSGTGAYTLPANWFSFLPEAYAGGFSVSAEFGHYFIGAAKTSATAFVPIDLPSYNYGNIGVSHTHKNLLLDLRYHTTDLTPAQCFTFTGDFRGYINGGKSGWCGDAIIGAIRWQASTSSPGVYAEPGGILDLFK